MGAVTELRPAEDWTAPGVICSCFAGPRAEGLVFCAEHHRYWFGGHRVPSVTSILSPLNDYSKADPERMDAYRQRGIAVHAATQMDDEGDLDMNTVDPIILPYLYAWRKFRAETGFEPIAIELRLYNLKHRYAGTLDRVGTLSGKVALLDIKSGETVPLSAGPQTAAYAEAWASPSVPPIRRRYVVQLRSTGDYQLIPYEASDDLQCFLAHLQIHRWREARA